MNSRTFSGNLNKAISHYKNLGYKVESKQNNEPRRTNKGLMNYYNSFN